MRSRAAAVSGPMIQTDWPNSCKPSAKPRHCSSVPPPVRRELNWRMRRAALEVGCKGVAGWVFFLPLGPEENKIVDVVFSFRIAVGNYIELTDGNALVLRKEKPFVAEIVQKSEHL